MSEKKNAAALGRAALFITAFIWGTSFVILKNTLSGMSAMYVLAFRFSGAAVLMALFGLKQLHKIDRAYLTAGALMGSSLFIAYVFQTYGLVYTTPGKNAFLTATYCVIVPFLNWLINKKKPALRNVIAVVPAMAGIGLVSLDGDFMIGKGDMLTAFCGIFFALHIIITARYLPGKSPFLLTVLQFSAAAALSWIFALITGPFPIEADGGAVTGIIYLCVMCTAVCFFLQTAGQKNTPPSVASLILVFESVFGALISAVFYREEFTLRLISGFFAIFAAVLISETELGLRIKRSDFI
ncbi:MAG: DMT family transporter [Oscillospiraceae bacterium]|nr:DMT family transporter [Oscillospiraceae bacterium]